MGFTWAMQIVAALFLVACACDDTSDSPAELDLDTPNVVIVGLDTVRADHLGVYGSQEVKTPHLDAFAKEAIVFERCGSTSTFTLPSFASLFTGLLPYNPTRSRLYQSELLDFLRRPHEKPFLLFAH